MHNPKFPNMRLVLLLTVWQGTIFCVFVTWHLWIPNPYAQPTCHSHLLLCFALTQMTYRSMSYTGNICLVWKLLTFQLISTCHIAWSSTFLSCGKWWAKSLLLSLGELRTGAMLWMQRKLRYIFTYFFANNCWQLHNGSLSFSLPLWSENPISILTSFRGSSSSNMGHCRPFNNLENPDWAWAHTKEGLFVPFSFPIILT